MCECVYRKFEQQPTLKKHLMNAPEQFVEASISDDYWGTGEKAGKMGNGGNNLGKILTALCDFYRDKSIDPYNFNNIEQRIADSDHKSFIVIV